MASFLISKRKTRVESMKEYERTVHYYCCFYSTWYGRCFTCFPTLPCVPGTVVPFLHSQNNTQWFPESSPKQKKEASLHQLALDSPRQPAESSYEMRCLRKQNLNFDARQAGVCEREALNPQVRNHVPLLHIHNTYKEYADASSPSNLCHKIPCGWEECQQSQSTVICPFIKARNRHCDLEKHKTWRRSTYRYFEVINVDIVIPISPTEPTKIDSERL